MQSADYSVDVIEGQPAVVDMTARANPSEIRYAWWRDSTSIRAAPNSTADERITHSGPLLNLTVVRRTDDGLFKCDATNSEGTQTANVRLNVQCNKFLLIFPNYLFLM